MALITTQTTDARVIFSDGEGLVSDDLNNSQVYGADAVYADLKHEMYSDFAPIGRCFSLRGQTTAVTPDTFLLYGGAFLARVGGVTYVGDSGGVNFLSAVPAAAAGMYRRDLVSVSFSVINTTSSRSFEDASSGALTTSNTDKTAQLVVEFHLTQGAEAVVADSLDPSLKVATPAGHHRVGEMIVGPAGIVYSSANATLRQRYLDWRVPAGQSELGFSPYGGSSATTNWSPLLAGVTNSTDNDVLYIPANIQGHRRVARVSLDHNTTNTGGVQMTLNNASGGGSGVAQHNFGATSSSVSFDMETADYPFWTNGAFSPDWGTATQEDTFSGGAYLFVAPQGGAPFGCTIKGVKILTWGK